MGKEDPRHPQPDDLPEHDRTGDEPNPSGNAPRGQERDRPPGKPPPRS